MLSKRIQLAFLIPNKLNEDLALTDSRNAQEESGSASFAIGDAGARTTSLCNGAEEHNSQGRAAENSFEKSHLPQVMTAPDQPSHNSQPAPHSTSSPNLPLQNPQPARGSTDTLNPPSHNSQPTPHEECNEQNGTSNEAQVLETNVIPRLFYDKGVPDVQITREVTKSWKSKFDESYVQRHRVPLLKKFPWESLIDAAVRDSFEKIRSRSLSNILNKINNIIYDNIKKHWESDRHKKLSQINKTNRMKEDSLSSPSSHCGQED
ncbi:hypothetical protein M9H77_12506 [Catharanthus roseus]|uniref:Uncharacterized protein n=1 Tax=Catharanthus roseus TaxID=4058 RepID=A0ACC0BHM3_CATRO|nr:hypothetical protein M9H77_12506 [Catharanthus roseus]